MIAPRLDPPPQSLVDAWHTTRNVRVEHFLDATFATEVLADLRAAPHRLTQPSGALSYQMATHENYPDATCSHALCRLVAWWFDEGRDWITALTGEPSAAPPSGVVLSTLYTKGCYLDPHNDQRESRVFAFVLGFTEERWPAHEGGHLEFLDFDTERCAVRQRREPGFNTLDLFDVRQPDMIHQIPVLRTHRERRVLSGWFHRPDTTPETATPPRGGPVSGRHLHPPHLPVDAVTPGRDDGDSGG